jgi:hypothetical protein
MTRAAPDVAHDDGGRSPSTSIETPMCWAVQRGSDLGVVSTGSAVSRAADCCVVVSRLEDDAHGSDDRTASTVPATRTAITPVTITQVSRPRVISRRTSAKPRKVQPSEPFRLAAKPSDGSESADDRRRAAYQCLGSPPTASLARRRLSASVPALLPVSVLHAADRLDKTWPALDLWSLDEVRGLAGVTTEPQLHVVQVIAAVAGGSWKRRVGIQGTDRLKRSVRIAHVRARGVDLVKGCPERPPDGEEVAIDAFDSPSRDYVFLNDGPRSVAPTLVPGAGRRGGGGDLGGRRTRQEEPRLS